MTTTSEVVDVTIDIRDAAVSQAGFGTPLVAAHHDFWPETVRTFSELVELQTPPLAVPLTHPVYTIARALKAQRPSPSQFKIGKRATAAPHVFKLKPTLAAAGETVFNFRLDGRALTATLTAGSTVAQACTAIAGAISGANPPFAATATATGTEVTVSGSVAGVRHSWSCSSGNISYTDGTTDPGIEGDLNAIRAYDADWYGLLIDSVGSEEILAAAGWAETQTVLFFPTLADADCLGVSTTDVASQLHASLLQRTIPTWHQRATEQWAGAAWAGKMLPKAPGSANWANKSLALVDMSVLDDTQRGNLRNKNCNYYVAVKGVGFTLDGRAAGGRYADITHGIDWFEARLEERIVGLLANNDKVPYTDAGIQLVRGQVDAQILAGITATIVDPAQDWWSSVPKVADVNPNDKIQRILRDVKFQFVLQGAINKVLINGTVLVAAA